MKEHLDFYTPAPKDRLDSDTVWGGIEAEERRLQELQHEASILHEKYDGTEYEEKLNELNAEINRLSARIKELHAEWKKAMDGEIQDHNLEQSTDRVFNKN